MFCRADGTGAGLTAGDDTVVGGPKTPQQIAAQKRLQQTQAQVDEVCIHVQYFTMYTHENGEG